MNATTIKRELAPLFEQRERLAAELLVVTEERDAALLLPGPRYDQGIVDAAGQQIARVERELARLALRIDALEHQLPTADELTAAEAERTRLLAALKTSQERYREAWRALFDALADVEPHSNELAAARRETCAVEARLKAQAQEVGLEVTAPPTWNPPGEEQKILYLRAVLLSEVAFGEPSDTVTLDLANALKVAS